MWGILELSLALSRMVVRQQMRPCRTGRLSHVMQSDVVQAGPQHTCCNALLALGVTAAGRGQSPGRH